MTDSKHTKGPWTFTIENDDRYIRAGGESMMCDTPYYPYCPSGDANWHLIAAAPDLLEVVKAFVVETVDYMTLNKLGDPEQQHNVKWARSVIAKAEGRASPLPADNGRAE